MVFIVCIIGLINTPVNNIVAKTNNQLEKNNSLVYLVDEKLGEGSYQYENLLDFEGNSRYILVKGDNCYLVFDTILEDYIEFSNTDSSFYDELSDGCEKIYLAPTYYFYRNNGSIYNLYDDNKLTANEVNEYKLLENELKKAYISINNGEKGTRNPDDDPVYISNRYYFDNLTTNFGSNSTNSYSGSCTYVALGMILAYYDSIVNDNIIEETYDVTAIKSFPSYSFIDVATYSSSPGIDDEFHEDLIQYGRDLGFTAIDSNSISMTNMDDLFEEYFDERELSITTHITNSNTNKMNFCKSAIDSDNPVCIAITGIDTNISTKDLNHAVVGYGYDGTGIYVHFGWKNNYHTNTNINNYTISNAFYIDFNSTHSHSNNYLWTTNGCSGIICPCGNLICNHGSYYYILFNMIRHKKVCNACGYQQNENHHFQIINNQSVCIDCGYGESNHQHNYTYTWINYTQHRVNCNCGFVDFQPHVLSPGAFNNGQQYATCLECGGLATSGIVIRSVLN